MINSFDTTSVEVEAGDPITLSWTTSNATECFAVNGTDGWSAEFIGIPNGNALLTLNTPGTHTYTLECTDGINIVSANNQVTVVVSDDRVWINSFELSPTEIDDGQSTDISWDVSNATNCTALDGTAGWPETSISTPTGLTNLVIDVPGCHTFTLECTDGSRTVSANQNMKVIDTDIIFADTFEPPVTCAE